MNQTKSINESNYSFIFFYKIEIFKYSSVKGGPITFQSLRKRVRICPHTKSGGDILQHLVELGILLLSRKGHLEPKFSETKLTFPFIIHAKMQWCLKSK